MVDQAKLSEFLGVTGCDDPAKARFFLESANGDLGAAVSAFYEHGDAPTDASDPSPPSAPAPTPAAGSAGAGPASAPAARPAPARASTRAASNVRGFGDLGGRDDADDDDDKPQEWFTGGAQSGSVVQDPKKPQTDAERLERMLDGARAAGATQGNAEDLDPRGRARPGAFSGTGRTLGSTAGGPEDAAASAGASAGASAAAPPSAPTPETHTIVFWTNGFTVNDGPLRAYDDPANIPFMQSVGKGQCPRELQPADPNTPININLVKKESEYEPPPEPKYRAFAGEGRTLGGGGGGGDGGAGSSETAAAAAAATAASPPGEWSVDESKPVASVQLRLRDGTRLVAKFNTTHTVADVRAFIATAAPAAAGDGSYTLQLAGFPPQQLTDPARLISDGLAGAVIIQR